MKQVTIEKISYAGWSDAVRVSNGEKEIVVLVSVGPRIIRYATVGGPNQFCNVEKTLGRTGDDTWNIYGGHRLWHSPEDEKRTYHPDNFPVKWEKIENGIVTYQPTETFAQIEKKMEIVMDPETGNIRIRHTLTNRGAWAAKLSVWALTVMDVGGMEVVPQVQRPTGLLHNRTISLWSYTRMSDPRVIWGDRYICLRQDPNATEAFKFGITNEDGWAAYFNHDQLFIKRYTHVPGAEYPDNGMSYETYTADFMLEMESLSPMVSLETDQSVEHEECWELHDNVARPDPCEKAIAKALEPYI